MTWVSKIIWSLIGVCLLAGHAAAEPFVVVTASDSAVADSLPADEIERLFLRRKRQWDNGERVLPLHIRKGSKVRKAFLETVLGMSERQHIDFWQREKVITGLVPPKSVRSERSVLKFVRTNPNSIGYMSATFYSRLRAEDRGALSIIYQSADADVSEAGDVEVLEERLRQLRNQRRTQ